MVALPNRLRKRTGKALHRNSIHLKDNMTSMRKTITDIMIMAVVMGRATMINTNSQAMAGELVHVSNLHRKIKATLHNKATMIMAGQEVVEIRDHKVGVLAEAEAQIMDDHPQRIVVEAEEGEATLIVMVRP
jgi:hypothetical protein